jgi:ribonuclease BN (tRNA processing enzyme)
MCGDCAAPFTRRSLIASSARVVGTGAVAALGQAVAAHADPQPVAVGSTGRTQVFLLGSQGGQQRTLLTGANFRAGTAVLIVIDGVGYLIDAGVGALLRLNQAGFDANAIRHVFMTHHHQDHNADLGNVIGFAWSSGRNGSDKNRRLDVWGPPGTLAYVDGYKQALALSIADQQGPLVQRPFFNEFVHAHEFPLRGRVLTHPVTVMRDSRVQVWTIRVNHGSIPSAAYRIKTPDLDIALSGDRGTRGDHLRRLIADADILLHEISDTAIVIPTLEAQHSPKSFIDHQAHDHSPPRLVASTAAAARPKQLILYHLIPGTTALTDDHWQGLLSPHYKGQVIVGRDLLEVHA